MEHLIWSEFDEWWINDHVNKLNGGNQSLKSDFYLMKLLMIIIMYVCNYVFI